MIFFPFTRELVPTAELNQYALLSTKQIFNNKKVDVPNKPRQESGKNFCHFQWLKLVTIGLNKNEVFEYEKLIKCSYIFVHFLRTSFNSFEPLALLSTIIYPDDVYSLYWLAESKDPQISKENIEIYNEIIKFKPKDGLAWCRLGQNLLYNEQLENSLSAYKECCKFGDPGVNGCYNSGRLLENKGDFDQAIYYYNLSTWQHSKDQALRLETKLSSE